MQRFRYLDSLITASVVVLLVANLMSQKICRIGPMRLSAAVLLFPITYIFGDIFTEVYGYAASRRAIWLGFFGTALLWAAARFALWLPSDPNWKNQQAFVTVFDFLPRMLAASLVAFFAGDFANSYTMARMKLATNGRFLWTRTVGSTVVGQGVDTLVFILLTFVGTLPANVIVRIILTNYFFKVAYEVVATPLTYAVVGWLKKAEGVDTFDRHTDFNPFHFAMRKRA
jgi:uncharacterized integral membrane protein (TIGR00697 family)